MPQTYKGKSITLDLIQEKEFGFPAEMREVMQENLEFAAFVLDAYIEADNRNSGLAAGRGVWADMYSTDDAPIDVDPDDDADDDADVDPDDDADVDPDDDADVDPDDDADVDPDDDADVDPDDDADVDPDDTDGNPDKADTGYDFESAEAKLASIDATLEAMADNPIVVESLATTRAALVQEMATARGAAQENAGRSLVLSFRKDILEMAMSFRETYKAQAGKRLDNFVLQFVRNPSATPVSLGYEFGEGEERETDTISVKVHPNFTQAPTGATATPNRATRQARSGNADGKTADERKAERELKDAAKAAEKENKAREEARIAAVIANGDIHGMVVTAPNGTIERVSLLEFVEAHCPDEKGGKQSRHYKGGWRRNLKSGFPQKAVRAAEKANFVVTANS